MTRAQVHEIAVLCKAAKSLAKDAADLDLVNPAVRVLGKAIECLADAVQKLTEGVTPNPKG